MVLLGVTGATPTQRTKECKPQKQYVWIRYSNILTTATIAFAITISLILQIHVFYHLNLPWFLHLANSLFYIPMTNYFFFK